MSVQTSIKGLDMLRGRLDAIHKRAVSPLGEIGPEIHAWMIRRMIDAFRTGGQSQGSTWPAYGNEPKYERLKSRAADAMTVLRWVGGKERLYPSLTIQTHPEHVWRQTPSRIQFGTRVPWAKRLEQGGPTRFGETAPPREFARLAPQDQKRLAAMVGLWVVQGKQRGAFFDD